MQKKTDLQLKNTRLIGKLMAKVQGQSEMNKWPKYATALSVFGTEKAEGQSQ